MEHKGKRTTERAKAKAKKASHTGDKHKAERKAAESSLAEGLTLAKPFATEDAEEMAVLSETQKAQVFDMSATAQPALEREAVETARVQAALEPVGTEAALEPIVTEDGVVTK
jgi:hypothetical protein